MSGDIDTPTDWYISRAHAVRALEHMGAELADDGEIAPTQEMQEKIIDLFARGLNATVEEDDRSPVDERHFK